MRIRWIFLGVAVLVVVLRSVASLAASSASDPQSDTVPIGGTLDLKTVATTGTVTCPSSAAQCITFSVDTAADFTPSNFGSIEWKLDLNNNGTLGENQDACIFLEKIQGDTGPALRATLKTGAGCADNGPTADPTTSSKHLDLSFLLSDIQEAGLGSGTTYKYLVLAEDNMGRKDAVPDQPANPPPSLITATLAAGTSTPTPSPSPSPSPTASGSPSPTPTISPTPSPGPNDTSASGTPSKSTVAPGESVTLSATSGFKASTTLTAVMNSDPVTLASTITANATGGFSATVTIPSSATVGSHSIVVAGANNKSGIHRITFPITVAVASATSSSLTASASPTASSGATLPRTGLSIFVLLVVAAVLVFIGIELFAAKDRLERKERES